LRKFAINFFYSVKDEKKLYIKSATRRTILNKYLHAETNHDSGNWSLIVLYDTLPLNFRK